MTNTQSEHLQWFLHYDTVNQQSNINSTIKDERNYRTIHYLMRTKSKDFANVVITLSINIPILIAQQNTDEFSTKSDA